MRTIDQDKAVRRAADKFFSAIRADSESVQLPRWCVEEILAYVADLEDSVGAYRARENAMLDALVGTPIFEGVKESDQ